jgi:hypothetical protein
MNKVITEIQFTDKNLVITQTGFLGLQSRKVVVPQNSIEKFKFELVIFKAEWNIEIVNKTTDTHLRKVIKLSSDHKLELEEGIGNLRDYDKDCFAIYDIYGEEMFNDFYHNTIILPFKFILELIDIICKGENTIKELTL